MGNVLLLGDSPLLSDLDVCLTCRIWSHSVSYLLSLWFTLLMYQRRREHLMSHILGVAILGTFSFTHESLNDSSVN